MFKSKFIDSECQVEEASPMSEASSQFSPETPVSPCARLSGGSSPSQSTRLRRISRPALAILRDKLKKEEKQDFCIGKSLSTLTVRSDSAESLRRLEAAAIVNQRGQQAPSITFIRKILQYEELGSLLALSHTTEVVVEIGTGYVRMLSQENLLKYLPIYTFVIMATSPGLCKIICDHLKDLAPVYVTGVLVASESLIDADKRLKVQFIQRIPLQSGGIVIMERLRLWLMSIPVILDCQIYSAGRTRTLAVLKLKEEHVL